MQRTYPNEEYFKKAENQKKLRNILLAYSRRNSKIGYCQGFNFIVAKLLMLFDREEDVFWIFVQIIENILPCEYYSELVGIMGDCSLCLKILKETNKKIMKKIEGFEVILNNLLYKWFISLFIENASKDTFINIWDAMIFEGNVILFRAVSAILEYLENDILRCEGMEQLTILFEEKVCKLVLNREKFLTVLLDDSRPVLNIENINNLRDTYYKQVVSTIIKSKKNEKQKKNPLDINGVEIECDLDWPFCFKEFEDDDKKIEKIEKIEISDQEKEIKSFELKSIQLVQTFRTNNPLLFLPSYFDTNNNEMKEENKITDDEDEIIKKRKLEAIFGVDPYQRQKKISISDKLKEKVKIYQNLLIQRSEHLCRSKKQTSEEILAQDINEGTEQLSDNITRQSNMASMFLSNVVNEVNKNEITDMIGCINKKFSSEMEVLGEEDKIALDRENNSIEKEANNK